MPMLKEFPIHKWCGGTGHDNRGRMVVSTLSYEVDLDPVYDCSTINFGSGVKHFPSESSPCLVMHEVFPE